MNLTNKILLIFFNILLIIFLSLILPLRFEENDDVMILLFSSGNYTGQPENILVFMNIIYGSVLQVGLQISHTMVKIYLRTKT